MTFNIIVHRRERKISHKKFLPQTNCDTQHGASVWEVDETERKKKLLNLWIIYNLNDVGARACTYLDIIYSLPQCLCRCAGRDASYPDTKRSHALKAPGKSLFNPFKARKLHNNLRHAYAFLALSHSLVP